MTPNTLMSGIIFEYHAWPRLHGSYSIHIMLPTAVPYSESMPCVLFETLAVVHIALQGLDYADLYVNGSRNLRAVLSLACACKVLYHGY